MADIFVTPSTLEVDYDKNLTELYQAITDQNWERAVQVCRRDPIQAATWVVRHYDDDETSAQNNGEQEIMWRFLPLHSACARQPPAAVIAALLRAYPDGPKCVDDQGMYPLHYACGNQAARDVIRQLLVSFPEAAKIADPNGMLPVHYLACWGPSSVSVVDMILVANRNVATSRDADGNTPLDLALDGDYTERDAVVATLQKWINSQNDSGSNNNNNNSSNNNNSNNTGNNRATGNDSVTTRQSNSRSNSRTNTPNYERNSVSVSNSPASQSYSPTVSGSTTGDLNRHLQSNNNDVAQRKVHNNNNNNNGVRSISSNSTPYQSNRSYTRQAYSNNTPFDEEKKEHDYGDYEHEKKTMHSSANDVEVRRLQEELKSLKLTLQNKERHWEKKMGDTESTWQLKYDMLAKTCERQEDEIDHLRQEVDELQGSLSEKNIDMAAKDRELCDTQEKLDESKDELQGLRLTLGDLMDQHETHKKKSGHMNDRLGSLSASLESMMEHQSTLTLALKESNEKRRKMFETRQNRLREMLEMEQELADDENKLDNALRRQNREMEAIAAVLAAARDF